MNGQAGGEVIQQITNGTHVETVFLGQSVRIQPGPSWNRLSFNWFADGPGTIPTALGSVFILDQEYLGSPDGLSAATPGYFAESIGIAGGEYQFAPEIQLQSGHLYFFYANAEIASSGRSGDGSSKTLIQALQAGQPLPPSGPPGPCIGGGVGCQAYITIPSRNFVRLPAGNDANFVLAGTAVPEPSLGLPLLGILMVTASRLRRSWFT
jgi:hypothetical protein